MLTFYAIWMASQAGFLSSGNVVDTLDARTWAPGFEIESFVRIHEPAVPNAVATVTFKNEPVHEMDEQFEITYGDITIFVQLDWQSDTLGTDTITVTPPDGYIAVPESIHVPEYQEDQLHIYRYLGF